VPDVPADLSLRVGDQTTIELPNHGGGGYRWTVTVRGDCVKAAVDYDDASRPAPQVVGTVPQVLRVTALHAGEAELTLEEGRSWQSGPPTAAARVRVRVEERSTNPR
jgi:predicted secreted protein